MLKQIIKSNKFFYYPYFLLLFLSLIVMSIFDKGYLTILLNDNHALPLDYFFKYFTYVGTGVFIIPFIIILYFKNKSWAYFIGANYAVNGPIIHLLKRVIISENYRPYWYLKREFYLIPGMDIQKLYSMPSGHTNTAFFFFLGLSFFTKNKLLHFFFFNCAVLVAISRLYLYQHFLQDTVVGSMIAVIATTSLYILFKRKKVLE